jgi:hypothetical protein
MGLSLAGRVAASATPTNDGTDKPERGAMRKFSKLAIVGTIGLVGIGAWTLPAAAATLAWQFTGTPTATAGGGFTSQAFEYQVTTLSTSVTVTGLGEFDNGVTTNLGGNSGQGCCDTVYIGSGTAPNNYNGFASNALFSAQVTSADSSTVGTYWAFTTALTLDNGNTSFVLAPGSYWVAIFNSAPNYGVVSDSPVSNGPNDTLGTSGYCEINGPCDPGTESNTFGANFEYTATPLPAALPLFAGGLGMLGLLGGRLRKRKASAATAVA